MDKIAKVHKEYLRSAMFGANDALVSTTGVIAGVSTGTGNKSVIILAGVVTIMVEALSMGAGQYMSARTAHQFSGKHDGENPFISGFIMFASYFIGGLVTLITIIVFPVEISRNVAVSAALVGLFALGYFKGKVVKTSPLQSALEVLILGGITTAIGIIAGVVLKV